VFAELPALLAGELAPLTGAERRVLLDDLLARVPLRALARSRRQRGLLDAVDRLFGDLMSEGVTPERLGAWRSEGRSGALAASMTEDCWEDARDEDLSALYAAYRDALAALPPVHGVARSDGRDGAARAADAIRRDPKAVRRRVRRPFGEADEPVTLAIYGLNDLRRGWDHLLDALRAAPFVDDVRVYVPLDHLEGPAAAVARDDLEPIGEFELLDALLARHPDRVVRLGSAAVGAADPAVPSLGVHSALDAAADALAPLRRTLLRVSVDAPDPAVDAACGRAVRALEAPDLAREVDEVARRVKRLIVEDGVAPHTIAVVSRKSRPYGPRIVEALGRHGVPVTARLRTNLAEVPPVAALLRVFQAGAEGFAWLPLLQVAESPYFDLALDVGLLKRASARGRYRTLAAWGQALGELIAEAAYEAQANVGASGADDVADAGAARARRAAASFAAFRDTADAFTAGRTRAEWIALALRCLGRTSRRARTPPPRDSPATGSGDSAATRRAGPHDERDLLLVDATRRDGEGLGALAGAASPSGGTRSRSTPSPARSRSRPRRGRPN
jgi:hypothetical protein